MKKHVDDVWLLPMFMQGAPRMLPDNKGWRLKSKVRDNEPTYQSVTMIKSELELRAGILTFSSVYMMDYQRWVDILCLVINS